MSTDDPQIRVVLDKSALTGYARLTGLAVGELIAIVEEEQGAALVGVPAAHFMAAHAELDPDSRVRLLRLVDRRDGVIVVLPLMGGDVAEAAGIGHRMGHAVVEARRRGAYLATYDVHDAFKHLPKRGVLALEDL